MDIPSAVTSIPTRTSGATHEIFFIADLHPVSYKTFYIRKVTRDKRSAYDIRSRNEYSNINEYWRDIKERSVVDIKNLDAKHEKTVFLPIYDHNNINAPKEGAILFDTSILDDEADNTKEIDQLVQIIQEHKKKRQNQVKLSKISDDEMRMLGDDPMVVNRYRDDTLLENEVRLALIFVLYYYCVRMVPNGSYC